MMIPPARLMRKVQLSIMLASVGLLGCGYEQYEARLKQSKDYFTYLDTIEQNLAPDWSDGHRIFKIRVPKQFKPLAEPQPIQKEDGTTEMPKDDPRQPTYQLKTITLDFPEVIGAWTAPVSVALPDGGAETRNAYIYAVSNYWVFAGDNAADATSFNLNLVDSIGAALGTPLNDEKRNNPETEMRPKPNGYKPQATFNVFRFPPKAISQDVEGKVTTVNYTIEVYDKQNGEVQGQIIVLLPEGIDQKEKINERIPMMLESVIITKDKPAPGLDKNAAPAAAAPIKSGF